MPSIAHPRSLPTPVVILIGMAAFALGLLAALSSAPHSDAQEEEEKEVCLQPAESGCPMPFGLPLGASLLAPADTHNWLLNVESDGNFKVSLFNLSADYRLWVYGPDDSLLGTADTPGLEDEAVEVANMGAGTYWIVVDSANGEWSDLPYVLVATFAAVEAPVPFETYGVPPPSPFQPYR